LTYDEELITCDESTPTIVGLHRCDILMTSFIAAPFTLTLDTLIVAKVTAINSIGMGPYSSVNTACIKVQTIP
jgi:predicted phosphoribosyltransferase